MKRFAILIMVLTSVACLFACTSLQNIQPNKQMTTDSVTDTIVQMVIASDKRIGCGVAPQPCLLIKYNPEDQWQYFYSEIQGFKHEKGFEYNVTLQRTECKNPPQDASRYSYKLIKINSKTRKQSANLPKDQ